MRDNSATNIILGAIESKFQQERFWHGSYTRTNGVHSFIRQMNLFSVCFSRCQCLLPYFKKSFKVSWASFSSSYLSPSFHLLILSTRQLFLVTQVRVRSSTLTPLQGEKLLTLKQTFNSHLSTFVNLYKWVDFPPWLTSLVSHAPVKIPTSLNEWLLFSLNLASQLVMWNIHVSSFPNPILYLNSEVERAKSH